MLFSCRLVLHLVYLQQLGRQWLIRLVNVKRMSHKSGTQVIRTRNKQHFYIQIAYYKNKSHKYLKQSLYPYCKSLRLVALSTPQ